MYVQPTNRTSLTASNLLHSGLLFKSTLRNSLGRKTKAYCIHLSTLTTRNQICQPKNVMGSELVNNCTNCLGLSCSGLVQRLHTPLETNLYILSVRHVLYHTTHRMSTRLTPDPAQWYQKNWSVKCIALKPCR